MVLERQVLGLGPTGRKRRMRLAGSIMASQSRNIVTRVGRWLHWTFGLKVFDFDGGEG